jgi:hypothetical protein
MIASRIIVRNDYMREIDFREYLESIVNYSTCFSLNPSLVFAIKQSFLALVDKVYEFVPRLERIEIAINVVAPAVKHGDFWLR